MHVRVRGLGVELAVVNASRNDQSVWLYARRSLCGSRIVFSLHFSSFQTPVLQLYNALIFAFFQPLPFPSSELSTYTTSTDVLPFHTHKIVSPFSSPPPSPPLPPPTHPDPRKKKRMMLLRTFSLLPLLASAAAQFPVGTIGNGTCGPTTYGADCSTAVKGSFPGMKSFAECEAKIKTCAMGNYVSFSLQANDCSWYQTCEFDKLCADCSKPGPNCPNPATGGCPQYYPFESEVLHTGPSPPPSPPPPPSPSPPLNAVVDLGTTVVPRVNPDFMGCHR